MSIPRRLLASSSAGDTSGPTGWQYPGHRDVRQGQAPELRARSAAEKEETRRRRRDYRERKVAQEYPPPRVESPPLPTRNQIERLLQAGAVLDSGAVQHNYSSDAAQAFLNYPDPSAPPSFAPSSETTGTELSEEEEEQPQLNNPEKCWKWLYKTAVRRQKQRRLWLALHEITRESEHLRWSRWNDIKKTAWEAFIEKLRTSQGRGSLFTFAVRAIELFELLTAFLCRTQGFWRFCGAAGAGAAAAFHYTDVNASPEPQDPPVGFAPTESPGDPLSGLLQ
jgi:hypothetical protein